MQNQLSVTEVDAFRQTGRPGGVECSGARILVEIGKGEVGRRAGEQFFVFGGELDRRLRPLAVIVDDNKCPRCRELALDRFQHRNEIDMREDGLGAGVVEGVENLLVR